MSKISVLSPHVADLIAAGEVVERPASVVKELMENAFDAGAHSVVVEIRGGGRESIRVTDDGIGMSPEDAGICFLRHATSKLRTERDLEAIGTMGFRGEALAAISSVSRITLLTRQRGAAQGVRVELTAGEIDDMCEQGCPEGTTMLVRELFYNTPARLKFLSGDRAEASACVQTALRSALGRPDVSVRCIKDGEEVFFSPGDGRIDSAIYALLGRETAGQMLACETERDGVRVEGFVSSPEFGRGNRTQQNFFCNGRPIRSKTLTAALEQAYKNRNLVGRFPSCVLYITLSNAQVDVNVHPTKAEVRFSREREVFDGVYYAALAALSAEDRLSVPELRPNPKNTFSGSAKAAPRDNFFRTMSAEEYRSSPKLAASGSAAAKTPAPFTVRDASGYSAPAAPGTIHHAEPAETPEKPVATPKKPAAAPHRAAEKPAPRAESEKEKIEYIVPKSANVEKPVQNVDTAPEPKQSTAAPEAAEQTLIDPGFAAEPYRFVGEALNLYILIEQGDRLIFVDKHAAHERLLFDKIRLEDEPLMAQELLVPETVKTDPDGMALAEENAELLARLGFELEPFGEESLMLRAVPADVDAAAAVPLLEELIEKLREGRRLGYSDVRERVAETIACKAAIKGGWVTEPAELLALAERVLRGDVKYCPHGRPVSMVFTRSELDKRFARIL